MRSPEPSSSRVAAAALALLGLSTGLLLVVGSTAWQSAPWSGLQRTLATLWAAALMGLLGAGLGALLGLGARTARTRQLRAAAAIGVAAWIALDALLILLGRRPWRPAQWKYHLVLLPVPVLAWGALRLLEPLARRLARAVPLLSGLLAAVSALLPLARPPAVEQPTRDWSAREQDEAARQAALRWTLAPDTNLIFISIDTLRADHMSLHGYPRVTTPFLDELAGRGVVFDQAYVQKTHTAPSFATMFTGSYPHTHGVAANRWRVPPANQTLAELLHDAGYDTAALTCNAALAPEFGFNQGFDHYERFILNVPDKRPIEAELMNQETFAWLDQRTGRAGAEAPTPLEDPAPPEDPAPLEDPSTPDPDAVPTPAPGAEAQPPFFLWVHYIDPHTPLVVPPAYQGLFDDHENGRDDAGIEFELGPGETQLQRRFVLEDASTWADYVDAYDEEVRYLDDQLRVLFERFEADGLLEDSLVVIVADHGEGLGEHDRFCSHGHTAYQMEAHVPMMLVHPELPQGLRVPDAVQVADLVPTVLSLLSVQPREDRPPPAIEGHDLLPLFDNPGSHQEPVYIDARYRPGYAIRAIVDQDHKLILDPIRAAAPGDQLIERLGRFWLRDPWSPPVLWRLHAVELYDLAADPGELQNLASERAEMREQLRETLLQHIASAVPISLDTGPLSSEELGTMREELRAMGYTGN